MLWRSTSGAPASGSLPCSSIVRFFFFFVLLTLFYVLTFLIFTCPRTDHGKKNLVYSWDPLLFDIPACVVLYCMCTGMLRVLFLCL